MMGKELVKMRMKTRASAAFLTTILVMGVVLPASAAEDASKKAIQRGGDDLRLDLHAVSLTQTEILSMLDRLESRLQGMEKDGDAKHAETPAPTARALVHPGERNQVSYTQDAINAQGHSTMVFSYAPEHLYKIYCRRGYLTDLAFRKGEVISFVGGGDTAGWSVAATTVDGTPHLYIKPVVETSTTNLIVTTNKRSYQLLLHTSDWYNPMVTWTYGMEDAALIRAEDQREQSLRTGALDVTSVEALDFNYRIKGKQSEYRPKLVFSDGTRVYLKFDKLPRQQVPIFVKEPEKQQMTLVNYRQKDDCYIIEVPFDVAQLRVSERDTVTIEHRK